MFFYIGTKNPIFHTFWLGIPRKVNEIRVWGFYLFNIWPKSKTLLAGFFNMSNRIYLRNVQNHVFGIFSHHFYAMFHFLNRYSKKTRRNSGLCFFSLNKWPKTKTILAGFYNVSDSFFLRKAQNHVFGRFRIV